MFCRNCGKELAGSPQSCFSCGATPVSRASCFACGASTRPLARICVMCGARLTGKRARRKAPDIYDPAFDLNSLSEEQRSQFRQHQFAYTFSTDGVIMLHLLTMGIFTLIYFGLMHSKLPMIKHDDFKARRAIGFSFIPFFNLYWVFRFWLRLVDRVNLQMRLRGLPPTVSKRLMLATIIVGLVPGVNLAALLVMYPLCIAQIQTSCNIIVPEESGQYKILLEGSSG
ncbi:MAG: zinc ribbon domain-containing protein [Dehalococcoidia bacterium]